MLKEAKQIYIFGPGEAKIELKKKIEENNMFLDKISDMEVTDKLTEPQIVAKVENILRKNKKGKEDLGLDI
ncbi:MAG: hypothetical protein A2163_05240 [Actinobacteria bacterium RBG_13_35_12]|uniref:Uncharacterized protein n=1 Tax=Candidatus Sediminicultor quintus TaxID=1797291 RepID=A0A1F5A859_9BACT|nr:MAG: hypothetical protein A2163_05240 [Actinobacteria bacterium RBG_13_35_12]OGD14755.1 MAG: hypothetical protein A2V47_01585 [Candidatus Atribacteria bacterium RBG_19FT_COMBO_35_14]OGD31410.1 MAG: hypothetical protein A2V94_06340 [Candidatus Atribacteria bacterium RBG_16_35_8]